MNRKMFLQIAAAPVLIGLLLLAGCLAGVWYINRLQGELARVLKVNVTSLQAAQELEIRLRQLRFHSFVYLVDPRPDRLAPIESDNSLFQQALRQAREVAGTTEQVRYLDEIEAGYQRYRKEMTELREPGLQARPRNNFAELADAHPVRHIVEPCQRLLQLNRQSIEQTSENIEQASGHARLAMLALGFVGPLSGLIIGYGIARGVSRSIYKLSLRVQDMAHHLDQDVASVVLAADGDLQHLDRQLEHVVARVEEVGKRLQRHQREMLRAEQLAAVGQLAASIAHEVRNPLTSVKMLVEAALRSRNQKVLTGDDLRIIHGEIGRLEQTVQNFLDFARPPAPLYAPCDLREVVRQALEPVHARIKQQQVLLTLKLPERPVIAQVDRNQLATVLVNLVINALDAMPGGGKLEMELHSEGANTACIRIIDTGSGIAADMIDRLFEPFASSKPTGTGLGLSICRRVIEEHEGSITAANRQAGGACFSIRLPLLEAAHVHATGN
jgi:signal transduction histidine kinase